MKRWKSRRGEGDSGCFIVICLIGLAVFIASMLAASNDKMDKRLDKIEQQLKELQPVKTVTE